ncbi:MAG: RNA polymerase sporulation sigma factor SigK [Roseburia sp.]|nr:RNA polymerase sporulation sigma factor SigK [Roseburia sp.]MCM1278072.1 RNA polymerase sporulation sigma factor SigK [Robinsoniella sp.]
MQTFQKPLSETEEAYYIRLLREGDEAQAKEARGILIERNLRLVAHIAKKYQNVEEEQEDLISIGTIGLIKAVSTFDETKGSRLATYAARCIDNELLMLLRAKKKTSKEVSLYEPLGTDKEGNEINLLDITVSEQLDVVEQMATREDIAKLMTLVDKVLKGREKDIILMRYGLITDREITQREIGKALGISRSYVSRIEKKALCKLRQAFEQLS